MKIKKLAVPLSVLLLLLIALSCIDLLAARGEYDDLFFAAPTLSGRPGIPVAKLEEWNGDTLLLTYEVFSEKRIDALHSHYDVTMIGTNYTYPYVMRLPAINGSFFTQAAQERQSRSVTFNRTAAFTIFGSVDVQGLEIIWNRDAYTVTGVVDDGSENSNVYLPAAFLNEAVGSLLSQSNASEMEVQSAYQKIGVDDTHYTLVDLWSVRESIHEKWICALALGISVILAFALHRSFCICIRSFHQVKALLTDFYMSEIVKTNGALLRCAALACLSATFCAAALLILSVTLFGMILDWQNYGQLLAESSGQIFAGRILELHRLVVCSDVLLVAFAVGLVFVLKTAQINLTPKK